MISPALTSDPVSAQRSDWYLQAMERLVAVVQELSHARDVPAVMRVVRDAARNLTKADGATFILRDGDQCFYAEENAIAPLWKGRRFPMSDCISGWVMLNACSTVIEDIYADPRIPVDAYRPTFVKSLAMVPIRKDAPLGAIGNYWAAAHRSTDEEVAILQALADTTSVALENTDLYGKLVQQVQTLQEQQVRIREQHEALEVFTRALAHDLREPLRTMVSFSNLVREGSASPEDQQIYLQYVESAAVRMNMLIDTVAEYTQIDDPAQIIRKPCAMGRVVESVTANLARLIQDKGATVRTAPLPEVLANPAHMLQLMQNLVANAISHNAGEVIVDIRSEDAGSHWRFIVEDDGQGVPVEYRETIFLPFKRLAARNDCTGLGLAICHKIVSSYGGTIGCESAPGKGASFAFTLPKPVPPVPRVA
jgi:two-component system CheB/CheR fusion protein